MSKLQFSVFSAAQIRDHPNNTSPSKMQYSFTKSPRFPKTKTECQHAYYTLTEVRNRRAASFGYGTKSDFTKTVQATTPAPVSYNKMSDFDKRRATQYGKTFGVSRDNAREFGYILQGPIKNPGVGNYQLTAEQRKAGYTLRAKTNELHNPVFLSGKTTFLLNPGPGAYDQEPGIKSTGKHFYAKYQSSGACTINPPNSDRFPKSSTIAPGPNHYSNDGGLNGKAKYVLSNHRSNGTRAFSIDKRVPFTDRVSQSNVAPGPGSYRQTSDFGVYENPQKLSQTTSDFGRTVASGRHFPTQPDLDATNRSRR